MLQNVKVYLNPEHLHLCTSMYMVLYLTGLVGVCVCAVPWMIFTVCIIESSRPLVVLHPACTRLPF